MNNINLENVFPRSRCVTPVKLPSPDGDTKQIWHREDWLRQFTSPARRLGRYVHVIGRDGRYDLIDMWYEKPTIVATMKAGYEARLVDTPEGPRVT